MELYIHIPFCKKKCDYCDFYSIIPSAEYNPVSYFPYLLKEIELASKKYNDRKISTIFIGGGTPSILTPEQIKELFKVINQSFDISGVKEVTVECNPESANEKFFKTCKECGVDRISIGVQSLSDDNLKAVGRLHDKKSALECLNLAKSYFDKVSCDIIVGLPFDTTELVKNEIEELAKYVNHMSCYELMLNPETPLYEKYIHNKINLPNDDEVASLFDTVVQTLKDNGFERYEVSNFGKSHESIHNKGYWQREEYLGFGPGAHSYIKDKDEIRFENKEDICTYISKIKTANTYPYQDIEILSQTDIKEEEIFLGLRTKEGIPSSYFSKEQQEKFKDFIIKRGNNIALNDKGLAVMDSITIDLFPNN